MSLVNGWEIVARERGGSRAGMATAAGGRSVPVRLLVFSALLIPLLALLGGCVAAAPPSAPGYSFVCHAGVYQCTLPAQYPLGARCSCPALGAPSFGRVS